MKPSKYDLFNSALSEIPTSNHWGFFAHDDAPGGIGGGSGAFCWFASLRRLLDFLYQLPLIAHSVEDDAEFVENADRISKIRKVVEGCIQADQFDQSDVDMVNQLSRGAEQITWVGRFEELLDGTSKFAENLRVEFNGSDCAIEQLQVQNFIAYITDWGH